jgi:hypothetical protein
MSRRQVWKKEAKLDTVNGGCWICPVPWPWVEKTIELGMKRASRENEEVPADRLEPRTGKASSDGRAQDELEVWNFPQG